MKMEAIVQRLCSLLEQKAWWDAQERPLSQPNAIGYNKWLRPLGAGSSFDTLSLIESLQSQLVVGIQIPSTSDEYDY
jgi:hypothetical protein